MGYLTGMSMKFEYQKQNLLDIYRGSMAEQFVGQHLLYRQQSYKRPELYYWNREKKSSQAEVDYLISCAGKVVPVEVKAGSSGRLRSLHSFS